MRFGLQDIKKQVRRKGGELYVSLHFLRPGELHNEIQRLIDYHERLLNQPQRAFSHDDARACIGDYRLANCLLATLSNWYTWRPTPWMEALHRLAVGEEAQARLEAASITSPTQLRLALFDYTNAHHQGFVGQAERGATLQSFAGHYLLSVPVVEYLLALDSEEEALLVRNDLRVPETGEVEALYNQWVLDAALSNASVVHFSIDCTVSGKKQPPGATGSNTIGSGVGAVIKRLCYLARRFGVYYDLAYASNMLQLTLYGPQEMTGLPQQYGLRLTRLCRALTGYGAAQRLRTRGISIESRAIIEAEATIHFLQRSYRLSLVADGKMQSPFLHMLPPVQTSEQDASSLFDSSIEQSFAEAFGALASSQGTDGWRLEREPEPFLLEHGLLIPDFALSRAERRIYMEIIGFWTPAYRERKIQKLQQLRGRNDLILAIPMEARAAFESIAANFPIVWYGDQLSASEVLNLLRHRYDDFAERLSAISVVEVQKQVRRAGLLSESACYEVLHCYRRSELQRASEQVVGEDIAYAAGVGLYHIPTLEHLRYSIVEWIGTTGPMSLVSVLQECKVRWPLLANCEGALLEALLSLWPEIYVQRTSIFNAVVGVGTAPEEAGATTGTPPSQIRERRATYKKRNITRPVQEDLWN